MDRLLALLEREKPDVVACLGDLLETEAASKYPKEDPTALEDEFKAATDLLQRVRAASGASRCVLMEGNHDDNLRQEGRVPKALRSLVVPEAYVDLALERRNWEVYPYENSDRGVCWIGKLGLTHGFGTGRYSDRDEAVLMSGNRTGTLVVRGHTHRPVPVTQARLNGSVPLPFWFANVGTMGPLKPGWTSRLNTRDWAAAALVAEVTKDEWKAQIVYL